MTCHRCRGLMVIERFFDLEHTQIHSDGWRCVSCGNVLDALIAEHQRKGSAGQGRPTARRACAGAPALRTTAR